MQLYWFFFKPRGSITIFVSLACKWNRTWFTLLKCPQGCGDLDLQITRLRDAARIILSVLYPQERKANIQKGICKVDLNLQGWRIYKAKESKWQAHLITFPKDNTYFLQWKSILSFFEIVQGHNPEASVQFPLALEVKSRGLQHSRWEHYSHL